MSCHPPFRVVRGECVPFVGLSGNEPVKVLPFAAVSAPAWTEFYGLANTGNYDSARTGPFLDFPLDVYRRSLANAAVRFLYANSVSRAGTLSWSFFSPNGLGAWNVFYPDGTKEAATSASFMQLAMKAMSAFGNRLLVGVPFASPVQLQHMPWNLVPFGQPVPWNALRKLSAAGCDWEAVRAAASLKAPPPSPLPLPWLHEDFDGQITFYSKLLDGPQKSLISWNQLPFGDIPWLVIPWELIDWSDLPRMKALSGAPLTTEGVLKALDLLPTFPESGLPPAGGQPTFVVCNAPGVLVNESCTCPPPNTLVNGVCTAPETPAVTGTGTFQKPPAINITPGTTFQKTPGVNITPVCDPHFHAVPGKGCVSDRSGKPCGEAGTINDAGICVEPAPAKNPPITFKPPKFVLQPPPPCDSHFHLADDQKTCVFDHAGLPCGPNSVYDAAGKCVADAYSEPPPPAEEPCKHRFHRANPGAPCVFDNAGGPCSTSAGKGLFNADGECVLTGPIAREDDVCPSGYHPSMSGVCLLNTNPMVCLKNGKTGTSQKDGSCLVESEVAAPPTEETQWATYALVGLLGAGAAGAAWWYSKNAGKRRR